MEYLSLFRMPTPMKITGRSSSITNAFINSIIPVVAPSVEEVQQALEILGMTPERACPEFCVNQSFSTNLSKGSYGRRARIGYLVVVRITCLLKDYSGVRPKVDSWRSKLSASAMDS